MKINRPVYRCHLCHKLKVGFAHGQTEDGHPLCASDVKILMSKFFRNETCFK